MGVSESRINNLQGLSTFPRAPIVKRAPGVK